MYRKLRIQVTTNESKAVEEGAAGTSEWMKTPVQVSKVAFLAGTVCGNRCAVTASPDAHVCRVNQEERASIGNGIFIHENPAEKHTQFDSDGEYKTEIKSGIVVASNAAILAAWLDEECGVDEFLKSSAGSDSETDGGEMDESPDSASSDAEDKASQDEEQEEAGASSSVSSSESESDSGSEAAVSSSESEEEGFFSDVDSPMVEFKGP